MPEYTECMKSELDIFLSPPIQTSILRNDEIAYQPLSTLDNASVIEFYSTGHGDSYRDLSSIYVKFKLQLLKENDEKYEDKDLVQPGVVNNILHSLIKSVSVSLNGKTISQNEGGYHYRSYFENLLTYGSDAKNTFLRTSGWIRDTSDNLDNLTSINTGFFKRKALFKNSKIVEVMGKLHCDMFNQPLFLINNVDLRIVITLEKPQFFIMCNDTLDPKFKMHEATLFMKQITINPNILIAHNQVLQHKNCVYHYKRVEIKTIVVPPGTNSLSLDNIVHGVLPSRILFTMVDNLAYTGTKTLNPFNFQHFNMTDFSLLVNGTPYPMQPLRMNFEEDMYCKAYQTLFTGVGIHFDDRGHEITYEDFKNGHFILAYDLNPDYHSQGCLSLLDQGSIRIEAQFSKSFERSITVIIYAEYDSKLEIDSNRNIIL